MRQSYCSNWSDIADSLVFLIHFAVRIKFPCIGTLFLVRHLVKNTIGLQHLTVENISVRMNDVRMMLE